MKPWKTPMNGASSSRTRGRAVNSLMARRFGSIELRLGGRFLRLDRRAGDRRHDARRGLARLACVRGLDEQLRLLDALRRHLRGDALGRGRLAIEQVAAERALREAVEEALGVEE